MGGYPLLTSLNDGTSQKNENESKIPRKSDPEKQARIRLIRDRISRAQIAAENRFPDRFEWAKESPEAGAARATVDSLMGEFEEGGATLETVEAAWRAYLVTIDAKFTSFDKAKGQK